MLNRVQLIGSLGSDVETRTTQTGSMVANMRIATNERVKKGEEWADHVEWHRVIVFGKMAENCSKYLSKGSRCFVEGRLRTSKYTDKNGVEKYSTDIIADDIKFLNATGKKKEEKNDTSTDEDIPF